MSVLLECPFFVLYWNAHHSRPKMPGKLSIVNVHRPVFTFLSVVQGLRDPNVRAGMWVPAGRSSELRPRRGS